MTLIVPHGCNAPADAQLRFPIGFSLARTPSSPVGFCSSFRVHTETCHERVFIAVRFFLAQNGSDKSTFWTARNENRMEVVIYVPSNEGKKFEIFLEVC